MESINLVVQDYCKSKGIKVMFNLNQIEEKIGCLKPQLENNV